MENTVISNPTNRDILFGRHAQSWNHEGNRRFRSIVSKYQDAYHTANARVKKVAIVAKIVSEVQENGARFLKRDGRLQRWYQVDRKACIEKVGHAIRDKQAIANRSLRGRQEQYLKQKEEEHAKTKLFDLSKDAAPAESDAKPAKPDSQLSSSGRPVSDQASTFGKKPGMVPSATLSANPLISTLLQDKLWMQNLSSAPTFIPSGGPKTSRELDLVTASGLAMIHHNREVEEAARKLVAAEEFFLSIRNQQALEGELALLRRRSALLANIARPTNLPQGLFQESHLSSIFPREKADLLATLSGACSTRSSSADSKIVSRLFCGESANWTTKFG